jgi:hypothetical protein
MSRSAPLPELDEATQSLGSPRALVNDDEGAGRQLAWIGKLGGERGDRPETVAWPSAVELGKQLPVRAPFG